VQCDLTKAGCLDSYNTSYDQIFHLAAWTQAGDFCLRHPGDQWLINQKINTNVLDWWYREQQEAKLIFIGTSCAYPEDGPLIEVRYMDGQPTESLYTYAMTKRMLLQGARALQRQYGMSWLCLVPSTLYGPGYGAKDKQLHFIFDLVRKIRNAKLSGVPAVLWGDGYQRRELVHIEDFIRDLMSVNKLVINEIINIGAGEDHSIRDFAYEICKQLAYNPDLIQYDTTQYVGAKQKLLQIGRLKELLGNLRRVDLREGIYSIL
jgi:GDP-L-fucose synthase